MARKPKHEEHENHERWLVSYADFITLLFAFFVVMYSVSSVNEGKYRVLSDALVAAFRSPAKSMAPIQLGETAKSPAGVQFSVKKSPALIKTFDRPLPMPHGMDDQKEKEATLNRRPKDPAQAQKDGKAQAQAQQQKAQTPSEAAAAIQKMADDIEKAMQTLIEEKLINVRRSTFWLEVEINTSILYSSGSARLEAGAMPVLEELATILIPFPNVIHVEGFTDNVPISTLMYPSNWELSAARAASVVTLLEKAGVSPTRLAAIGHGEYQPVADNATAEGRARNRRVVVVVMSNVAEHDAPDAAASDGAGKQSSESTAAEPLAQPSTLPAPVKAAAVPREPGEPIDVTGEETVVSRFPIIRMPIALPFPARRTPAVITPPRPPMQPPAVPPTE